MVEISETGRKVLQLIREYEEGDLSHLSFYEKLGKVFTQDLKDLVRLKKLNCLVIDQIGILIKEGQL